jgi:hypothetical protein
MLAVLKVGFIPQNALPNGYHSLGQLHEKNHSPRPTGNFCSCLSPCMQENLDDSVTSGPLAAWQTPSGASQPLLCVSHALLRDKC